MKKWVALLGGAMFCVLFFSMYMVVDQLGKTPSYQDVFDKQINEHIKLPIENLDKDITQLERNLRISGKVINRIKDSVEQIQQGKLISNYTVQIPELPNQRTESKDVKVKFKPHKEQEPGPLTKRKPQDLSQLIGSDDGCMFTRQKTWKTTDVKMFNMMDMMPFDNPDGGVWKQGWDVSYNDDKFKDDPLQVFVVPHSHNDPGWIKTLDQYYNAQTRHILNNMVDALSEDKRRKFIWAEISYFSMWWQEADSRRRKLVLDQLKDGQFELVTGGWVMNDESNPHFYAMLDQMIEGHEWIRAHLGQDIKPVSGWAIDPFGHSSTMPYLLQRMGLHSMLIQRTHYQVKKYLAKESNLEFMWRQIWDHGTSTDMFTHMMPFYSYDVPHTCGPDPKICCQFDFRRLPGGRITCPWRVPPVPITDQNVAERARMLIDQYKKKSTLYKNNIVLIPLGDDFRYEVAFETHAQFANYQKLFDYINSHPELHAKAQFGTLKDYFNAIYKKTETKPGDKPNNLVTLSGDFFTYADREDHYWSGYFTSRPFYKNLDRVIEAHHRAAEILFYLADSHARRADVRSFPRDELYMLLVTARRNMGLFQHHDAITGTAKDFVVVDYGNRLHTSLKDLQNVMRSSAQFLLTPDMAVKSEQTLLKAGEDRHAQDALPTKELIIVSANPRTVYVYNSLAQEREQVVSLLVSEPLVTVTDGSGKVVESQTNLVWDGRNKMSSVKYELVFLATVPPLGLAMYNIKRAAATDKSNDVAKLIAFTSHSVDKPSSSHLTVEVKEPGSEVLLLENDHIKAEFDSSNGLLKGVSSVKDVSRLNVDLEFMTYGTKAYGDKSGAYLFLPDGPAKPHVQSYTAPVYFTSGKLMQEVRVAFPNVLHVVRLYRTKGIEGKMLDIQNTVDVRDFANKELVMRLRTDIKNAKREFYTDLNGFSIQKRKTLDKLPIQANFYPLPSMAFMQDTDTRMTLLSAQPNGVAALQTGMLEVVMDRRLLQDDNRGVGQGVMDNKETPACFRLLIEKFANPEKQPQLLQPIAYPSLLSHQLSRHLLHPQFTFLTPDGADVTGKLLPSFSGLQTPLPCDISLFMLRSIMAGAGEKPSDDALMVLHRKGYECGFHGDCLRHTSAGKVNLGSLFQGVKMRQLKPTSLTMLYENEGRNPDTPVSLNPMELYSYRINLS